MEYKTRIDWKRNEGPFDSKSFDRSHHIHFDRSSSLQASSAPEFLGNPELPNPELLFTAALSSCFMLTFLYFATVKGLIVDEYAAEATGVLAKNSEGKMAMTEIILEPKIKFAKNENPKAELLNELFKKSHENCFISSSIKTKVTVKTEHAVST